jgi:acyl carrier protein
MHQFASKSLPYHKAALPTQTFLLDWLRRHHHLPASSPLRTNARLDHDLGLDSLERVELIVDLENYYSVELPDSEINSLSTLRDVEACLQRQLLKVAA